MIFFRAVQQDQCLLAADFHLLKPNCMTAVIRPITELSMKLKFNDRFGCPHNAMCVCVMI